MKKLIVSILFLANQLVLSQTIVPLKTSNPANNTYQKDLDNIYLPYIGTWEGILNNKKYSFEFVKFEKHQGYVSSDYLHYRDVLKVKFKVTDLTSGTVLYDDTSTVNYEDYKILAVVQPSRKSCFCFFRDTEANCWNELEFTLQNIAGHPNQLKYCYFKYKEWMSSACNYTTQESIPVFLPKEDLILTKL